MSNSAKVFKKGEYLFKEGEKIQNLLLIQSGGVSLCLARGKKNIDLMQVGANQVLGENALSGSGSFLVSAVATTETKVLEIPVESLKQGTEQLPQVIKLIIKSLADRVKACFSDLKSSKMEKDSSPCPEDQVAQIFGAAFITPTLKGKRDEKDPKKISIEWTLFKNFAQRVLGESPKRLEQTLSLLTKHHVCKFEMGKSPEDPDGPDQILAIHFLNLHLLESFVDFYQYYYFKGGKSEILKVDDFVLKVLSHLTKLTEGLPVDRFGVASLELAKAVEDFKTSLAINLSSDIFARLEQKGVFVKRKTQSDGQVLLQIEVKEIQTILSVWKFLKEIEKWNEKGFVDLNENYFEIKEKPIAKSGSCPECSQDLVAGAKFCQNCGHKLAA